MEERGWKFLPLKVPWKVQGDVSTLFPGSSHNPGTRSKNRRHLFRHRWKVTIASLSSSSLSHHYPKQRVTTLVARLANVSVKRYIGMSQKAIDEIGEEEGREHFFASSLSLSLFVSHLYFSTTETCLRWRERLPWRLHLLNRSLSNCARQKKKSEVERTNLHFSSFV